MPLEPPEDGVVEVLLVGLTAKDQKFVQRVGKHYGIPAEDVFKALLEREALYGQASRLR